MHTRVLLAVVVLLTACPLDEESSPATPSPTPPASETPTFGAPGLGAAMPPEAASYHDPSGRWTVDIAVDAWGRDTLVSLDPADAVWEGETARRSWGAIEEWYSPAPTGVKHGFDLLERPDGEGLLTVRLAVDTELTLEEGVDEIRFWHPDGTEALYYRDLTVLDADGDALPSWMEVDGDTIHLVIDDTDASWPLWVDPLVVPPEPGDSIYDIVVTNNSSSNWNEGLLAVLPAGSSVDSLLAVGAAPRSGNRYRTYGYAHTTCDPVANDDGDADLLAASWTPLTLDDNAFVVPALAPGASATVAIQASPGEVLSFVAKVVGSSDDVVMMNRPGAVTDTTIDLFDGSGEPLTALSYDISGYDINSASSTNGNGASCSATCPPPSSGCFVAPNNGTTGTNAGGDQAAGSGTCRTFDWYLDGDDDGFGSGPLQFTSCTAPDGYSTNADDCNDADPAVNPDAEEIPDNGEDDDCVGGDAMVTLEVEDLVAGDLLITEVMVDPQNASTFFFQFGEWFELTNTTTQTIELQGLVLTENGNTFTVSGSNTVAAGERFVFGLIGDAGSNGGYAPDYVYNNGFTFNQFVLSANDTLTVLAGSLVIDTVTWTSADIHRGASLNLDPDAFDAATNDDLDNWCDGFAPFGSGDFGTPGAANTPCAFTISFDFNWVFNDGTPEVNAQTTLMADGDGAFTTGNGGSGTYTRTTSNAGQLLTWTYDNLPNVIYSSTKPFGDTCWPAGSGMTGLPSNVVSGEWGETGCPAVTP